MRKDEFVKRREPQWREFEALIGRLDRIGYRELSGPELLRLGVLYRRLTSDLAYVRNRYADPQLSTHLNRLAQRGYGKVYRAEPAASRASFFGKVFPGVLRKNMKSFGIATLLFYVPAIVAYLVVLRDRTSVEFLMGLDFLNMVESRISMGVAVPEVQSGEQMAMVSTAVLLNNVYVSILAFTGGALAGPLTLFSLVQNGLMLGSFAALFAKAGMTVLMLETILPHGVPELTAICLAGGAGLRLAGGILFPGDLPRRRSIAIAGREALVLFGGVVLLLVVAGVIEGYLSFTSAPGAVKWGVAGVNLLFCLYLLVWLPLRVGPLDLEKQR